MAPWSASRGAVILSRASLFRIVIAEIVLEEAGLELNRRVARDESDAYLLEELDIFLAKLKIERIPHATGAEFLQAAELIGHDNDAPVLAAAIRSKPDWLLTENTRYFNETVADATGLNIVTPTKFLKHAGKIFPL